MMSSHEDSHHLTFQSPSPLSESMASANNTPGNENRDSHSIPIHDVDVPSPIIIIAEDGDLVLCLRHETSTSNAAPRFRVQSQTLKEHSRYFAGLLDGRFEEGKQMARTHEVLKSKYGQSLARAIVDDLPVISIQDIGRISKVKSVEPLGRDFLSILHGLELQNAPPVANVANLAIVADRFDALSAVRTYVRRKKILLAIDGKLTPKADNALTEEKVRQRVLAGVLLDHGPWLEKYTQRMIVRGWTGMEALDTDALWWDLPSRLEEELHFRRQSILMTLQSLQAHFLSLYNSRGRQCRLGYDSSLQCDVFQLGQAIRFLGRIGTLEIQGTIAKIEAREPFQGDINGLIDALRQCPEYQVDSHHSHCGIRTKLLPILDLITEALKYVGVCAEHWPDDRIDLWVAAKHPLVWNRDSHRLRGLKRNELHSAVRTLFTADAQNWDA